MPDRRGICVGWLTRPLEKAELLFFKGIKADDLPSDDSCAICHEPYGTPNEDGTTPEHAVRFPCGHTVGNECFQIWSDGIDPLPGCIFCNKPLIPALYLKEQVEEIWTMVNKTSPESIHEEVNNKTTRGTLTRSIEPLQKYVSEAPSLEGSNSNEGLVPSFEWLLIATSEFLAAVEDCAEISAKTDGHETNYEALWRRKREFESNYERFQRVVEEMAMAQMLKEALVRSSLE